MITARDRLPPSLRLLLALYRVLLWSYPTSFRRAFGNDMLDEARITLEEARTKNGLMGQWWVWWTLVIDVLRTASLEKWNTFRGGRAQVSEAGSTSTVRETVLWNVRYAFRSLRRQPGYALAAIITLALGIGANTAVFMLINGILLEPLPVPESKRLVFVGETNTQGQPIAASADNFVDWREQTDAFEELSASFARRVNLTGVETPQLLTLRTVSANYFRMLRVPPALGRGFIEEEGEPGGDRAVVLSHGLWQSSFSGDPDLLGKSITLNGEVYGVVGIMSPDFAKMAGDVDLWTALQLDDRWLGHRGRHNLEVFGRLSDGVSLSGARTELATVAARLAEAYPETNEGVGTRITPLHQAAYGSASQPLLLLFGAVGFVLLIACVNVANLTLARGAFRNREIAIRTALGASRRRIMGQLMSESLILAVVGGAAGIVVGYGGLALLQSQVELPLPRMQSVGYDGAVLVFSIGLSLIAGLLTGLVPALRATGRGPGGDLLARGLSAGRRHRLVSNGLVVAEFALAVTLLIGAGLFVRSLRQLTATELGVHTENVVTFRVALPRSSYVEPETARGAVDGMIEHLVTTPGVTMAAATSHLPVTGSQMISSFLTEGATEFTADDPHANLRIVSPGYFALLDIPVVEGRAFEKADRAGGRAVVLINETARRQMWPDEDPLGRRVAFQLDDNDEPIWNEIVGVVADVRHMGPQELAVPEIYQSMWQAEDLWTWTGRSMTLMARSSQPLEGAAALARTTARSVDPDLPIFGLTTMDDVAAGAVTEPRFHMVLLVVSSVIALILSAVGVFAVMAFNVRQRTREIAIRMTIGAMPRTILRSVVGEAMGLVVVGAVLGVVGALAVARLVSHMLFGIASTDPLTYVTIPVVLAAVALVACLGPARRAATVDPIIVLRD